MTTNISKLDFSQVKGSLEMEVYEQKWKGSRCTSKIQLEVPIGGRAPSGASGSGADGSKVTSLPKNVDPRVHNEMGCVD